MSKPTTKYRAYMPVTMTDGILAWPQDRLVNTVGEWTDGDIDKLQASLGAVAPLERIKSMQARLDSLTGVTPMIEMYMAAIRAIHTGLNNHHSVTIAENRMLDEADRLWEKIIILRDVMPKAVKGGKFPPGREKGSLSPKTKYINQLVSMYPLLCPKELYKIADKSILGEGRPMKISTFDKKVSEARNPK